MFSAIFATSAFYFLAVREMGAHGLVYANCINMAARIFWSFGFIKRYFKRNGSSFRLVSMRPEPMSLAASLGAFAMFRMIKQGEFENITVISLAAASGQAIAV